MPSIYPRKESEFVEWTQNFQAKTTATPVAYSLTAPLALTYKNLNDDFLEKYAVCQNPATRTSMAIELKDLAKALLQDNARLLAGIVNRAPTTTNATRLDLKLPEYEDGRTPINAPTEVPV